MIRLSNRHVFEYMTASGALRWGKGWPWEQPWRWIGLLDPSLFTSVTKTLTLWPRKGNSWWNSVRLLWGGVANAVKLRNPGFNWWCEKIGPSVDSGEIPLVASVYGELEELVQMANILNSFDLVGIEFNPFCPNADCFSTTKAIAGCQALKEASRHPLFLKLSVTCDVARIVKEVEGVVEVININSVPWEIVFPNYKSPFPNGGGAVSGKVAQPFTWGLLKKLVELTSIPVVGPSIWDFEDIAKVRALGAKGISFGSIHLRLPFGPALPTWYVRKERKLKQLRV